MIKIVFSLSIILSFLIASSGRLGRNLDKDKSRNVKVNVKPSVWDVVVKTCDELGAGTDAAVYLKVYYEKDNAHEVFSLDNPKKNDFERNDRSHFKISLKYDDIGNLGLFWWPSYTFSENWCVDWVILLNSNKELCYEALFYRWILHYRDPPTYPTKFHRLKFEECVHPRHSI